MSLSLKECIQNKYVNQNFETKRNGSFFHWGRKDFISYEKGSWSIVSLNIFQRIMRRFFCTWQSTRLKHVLTHIDSFSEKAQLPQSFLDRMILIWKRTYPLVKCPLNPPKIEVKPETTTTPAELNVQKWNQFNDKLQLSDLPKPFKPVETLVKKYLGAPSTVLDIGCETGKNAVPLIQAGHKVTLLDIAPNAISYTIDNLQKRELAHGIQASVNVKIEDLPPTYGPFKAVVGTYAFSFIPPDLFQKVMKENVLGRVEQNGYFAGGFFGHQHAWSTDPQLSILTTEKLEELFASMGFSICEKEEKVEETQTVSNGNQIFHTIEVIAKRQITNPKANNEPNKTKNYADNKSVNDFNEAMIQEIAEGFKKGDNVEKETIFKDYIYRLYLNGSKKNVQGCYKILKSDPELLKLYFEVLEKVNDYAASVEREGVSFNQGPFAVSEKYEDILQKNYLLLMSLDGKEQYDYYTSSKIMLPHIIKSEDIPRFVKMLKANSWDLIKDFGLLGDRVNKESRIQFLKLYIETIDDAETLKKVIIELNYEDLYLAFPREKSRLLLTLFPTFDVDDSEQRKVVIKGIANAHGIDFKTRLDDGTIVDNAYAALIELFEDFPDVDFIKYIPKTFESYISVFFVVKTSLVLNSDQTEDKKIKDLVKMLKYLKVCPKNNDNTLHFPRQLVSKISNEDIPLFIEAIDAYHNEASEHEKPLIKDVMRIFLTEMVRENNQDRITIAFTKYFSCRSGFGSFLPTIV